MLSKERVDIALSLGFPDKVPMGEILISDGLIASILGRTGTKELKLQDKYRVIKLLKNDLICLPYVAAISKASNDVNLKCNINDIDLNSIFPAICDYEVQDTKFWSESTDLFVFLLIDGGFGLGVSLFGFFEFLTSIVKDSVIISTYEEKTCVLLKDVIKQAKVLGANGLILADDIAYDRGLFLSIKEIKQFLLPIWKFVNIEAQKVGLRVVFHSDGNIIDIIPLLIEAGFAGVHSLQPSAGMDIGFVKKTYGRELCLMGNFDLSWLGGKQTKAEVRRKVKETMIAAASGGGFIFGTCAGLMKGLSIENIFEMYTVAEEFGSY